MDHLIARAASEFGHSPPEYFPYARLADSAGTFERIEDKFLVPTSVRNALLAEIRAWMPASPFSGKQFTRVESIYFDSPSLSSFTDHFEIDRERFKLRTRRYGNDGEFDDERTYHLELKTKASDGISRKMRFKIHEADFLALSEGRTIHANGRIASMNPDIEIDALARRVGRINQLVKRFALRPILRVGYDRVAYETKDARVTVDDHIKYEKIGATPIGRIVGKTFAAGVGAKAMRNLFDSGDYSLLEVKYSEKFPEWLSKILVGLGLTQRSFSKYCYSVATLAATKR